MWRLCCLPCRTAGVCKGATVKCALCESPARCRFYPGRRERGRPPLSTLLEGELYCEAHYAKARRAEQGYRPRRSLKGVSRAPSVRKQVREECAIIAEHHGHADLAALFRRFTE